MEDQELKEKRDKEYKEWYRLITLHNGQRAFLDIRQIVEIGETEIMKRLKLYRYDLKLKDGRSLRITRQSFFDITKEMYALSKKGECKLK